MTRYRGPALFCLGVALGQAALVAAMNMPDRWMDGVVRFVDRMHRRRA